jgi:hypothetical protein
LPKQSLDFKRIASLRNARNDITNQPETAYYPNADKPQPKKSATEWNSHGRNFHEFISVRVLFREPDFFAFFAPRGVVPAAPSVFKKVRIFF